MLLVALGVFIATGGLEGPLRVPDGPVVALGPVSLEDVDHAGNLTLAAPATYTVPRKCLWAAIIGAGIGVAGTVLAGPILAALGFTSLGVSAGSLAAMWQSTMGGVIASGGLFATLQSIAMAGLGFTGAVTLTGGTAAAFATFCKAVDSACGGCVSN